MKRPQAVRRSMVMPSTETSMRILEYGVCVSSLIAVVLLGFVR